MTPDFRDYRGTKWLAHYGVKGMRKGVRRYQNEDGTLTPEGYSHYGYGESDGVANTGVGNNNVSQNKPAASVSVKTNDEEEKEESIKDRVESNNQKIAEAKEKSDKVRDYVSKQTEELQAKVDDYKENVVKKRKKKRSDEQKEADAAADKEFYDSIKEEKSKLNKISSLMDQYDKENYIDRTEVDENETEQERIQRENAKKISDIVRARDELNAEKEAKRKKELEEKRRLNRSRVKKVVSDRNQTGKTNTYYVSR